MRVVKELQVQRGANHGNLQQRRIRHRNVSVLSSVSRSLQQIAMLSNALILIDGFVCVGLKRLSSSIPSLFSRFLSPESESPSSILPFLLVRSVRNNRNFLLPFPALRLDPRARSPLSSPKRPWLHRLACSASLPSFLPPYKFLDSSSADSAAGVGHSLAH